MSDQLPAVLDMPHVPTKEDIRRAEDWMATQPPIDLRAYNHFAPGVYMREGIAPAGSIVTGREHRTEHFSILLQGKITVWTEQGMVTTEAPDIIRSLPGAKRIAYVHPGPDLIWLTVHPNPDDLTDETDLVVRLTFPDPRDPPELEAAFRALENEQ